MKAILSSINLFTKIEDYNFECEAGRLQECEEWIELKNKIDLWCIERNGEIIQHTGGKDGYRFTVFTNEEEAQVVANQWNNERYGGKQFCKVRNII